uniref:K Homology domain-containing protein n=1 Tax=viral metagenome TaxID=1070528 RepID=A0A6C0J7S5_9ZZZZ
MSTTSQSEQSQQGQGPQLGQQGQGPQLGQQGRGRGGQQGRGRGGQQGRGRGGQQGGQQGQQGRESLSFSSVPVTDELIGTVVGKQGATINKIKDDTGTRISHLEPRPEEGHLFHSFHISGSLKGVDRARRWILSILGNTYKMDHPDWEEHSKGKSVRVERQGSSGVGSE